MEPTIFTLLRSLGCRKTLKDNFILDEFDHAFYLRFDGEEDSDNPKPGTVDIYIMPTGSHPADDEGIRVVCDAYEPQVLRFLFAIGVDRFAPATRKAMYAVRSVIR